MKYIEINKRVKTRKPTWNERLAKTGIPSWDEMTEQLKKDLATF